ncbi:MAG TPA: hypothetical protein VLJ20_08610, partial [Acetobacteraceae bacterium]|nr:hypothetical protein [Acetobacteraceae bacterium]
MPEASAPRPPPAAETTRLYKADGLRARLALREAAGGLAHPHGAWVHPTDLALREAGLTGSLTAAA